MRLIVCSLIALSASAMSNGVVLYEASGITQTARPVTLSRVFAQGEFPANFYPKPRIGGVVPSAWQVDVKNTWPDGSVMLAFVSFPATVAGNGSAAVDFVKDANPCHLGNLAVCQAAALDQPGMAGFASGAWDFVLQGTANSVTYSASAKTMLGAGAWTYWLRGPVVTRVLVEDVSRPNPVYDFGWQWDGTAWQAPSADTYRSVHPMFMVSFYPGYTAGVYAEVMAQNAWTSRLQRQVFDLSVLTFGGAVAYNKPNFDLPARSMFSRSVWSGTAPGRIQIDHNLQYLVSTRVFPPFDYRQRVATSSVSTQMSTYDTHLNGDDPQSCTNSGYCASWVKYIPMTGGRGDIALIPLWYTIELFTMGDLVNYPAVSDRLAIEDKMLIGNANAALTMTLHYRDLDNSAYRDTPSDGQRYYFNYPTDATTPAWGHIISIQSRPTLRMLDTSESTGGVADDRIIPICSSDPCDGRRNATSTYQKGWTVDSYHIGSAFAVPYLLTGEYRYLMGLQSEASWVAGFTSEIDYLYYGTRGYEWGIVALYQNTRGVAWTIREIFLAAALSPDGTPEKAYFTNLLRNNEQFYEGTFNMAGNTPVTGGCLAASQSGTSNTTWGPSNYIDSNGATSAGKPNGVIRDFIGKYPIRTLTSVTVNGAAKTFGVKGVDSGKDWYYQPGSISISQDPAATPLASTDVLYWAYTYDAKPQTPWCSGWGIYAKGLDNPLRIPFFSDSPTWDAGSFMVHYWGLVTSWMATSGTVTSSNGKPIFSAYRNEFAKFFVGAATHPQANPKWLDSYGIPMNVKYNRFARDWTEWTGIFSKATTLDSDITSGATSMVIPQVVNAADYSTLSIGDGGMSSSNPQILKVDNEWVLVCGYSANSPTGKTTITLCGRGLFGTTASAHVAGAPVTYDRQMWTYYGNGHEYTNLYACVLAMMEDTTTPSGSGRRAWELIAGSMWGISSRNGDPQWMFVPRERITSVRAKAGVGTLSLQWVAPDGGECKYVAAPTIDSSDDSMDTSDGGGGRNRSVTMTLAAGTYTYRISCGSGRVVGTAVVR
jgi:hypothetical protein